jgi:hypothetical protein
MRIYKTLGVQRFKAASEPPRDATRGIPTYPNPIPALLGSASVAAAITKGRRPMSRQLWRLSPC